MAFTFSKVQSGQVTITSVSITASPTSYTLAKSILLFTIRGGAATPSGSSVKGVKTNSTTLTFSRASNVTADVIIEWMLLEFTDGVTVQDLEVTITADQTDAITAVVLNDAFIIAGGVTASGSTYNTDDQAALSFSSTTLVQADLFSTANLAASYQVIETPDANVTENVWTFSGTDPETLSITSIVSDRSSTFSSFDKPTQLYDTEYSIELDSDGAGLTARRFDQVGSDPSKGVTYVVEWPTSVGVQHGSVAVTTEASKTEVITSVTQANSVVYCDASGGCGGKISGYFVNDTDDADVAKFTAKFNSDTEIQFDRITGGNNLTTRWQVAEFGISAGGAYPYFIHKRKQNFRSLLAQ